MKTRVLFLLPTCHFLAIFPIIIESLPSFRKHLIICTYEVSYSPAISRSLSPHRNFLWGGHSTRGFSFLHVSHFIHSLSSQGSNIHPLCWLILLMVSHSYQFSQISLHTVFTNSLLILIHASHIQLFHNPFPLLLHPYQNYSHITLSIPSCCTTCSSHIHTLFSLVIFVVVLHIWI